MKARTNLYEVTVVGGGKMFVAAANLKAAFDKAEVAAKQIFTHAEVVSVARIANDSGYSQIWD